MAEQKTESDKFVEFLDNNAAELKTVEDRNKALSDAITSNNDEKAKQLIAAGADAYAPDESGRTPLMKAVQAQNLEMVKYLIDKEADVDAKDNTQKTALDYARDAARMKPGETTTPEDKETLKQYFKPEEYVEKSDFKIRELTVDNDTPSNMRGYIEDMVENGYATAKGIPALQPSQIKDADQRSMLESHNLSKARGIVALLQDATSAHHHAREARSDAAHDALYDAVISGDKNKVEQLLKDGADATKRYVQNGWDGKGEQGLLQIAAERGSGNGSTMDGSGKWSDNGLEIARMLVAYGAVDVADQRGVTALMEAAKSNDAQMVHVLAKAKGANVNAQDGIGFTALHYATDAGSLKAVQALIEERASLDIQDGAGKRPLERMRIQDVPKNIVFALPTPQLQRQQSFSLPPM